MLLGSAGGGRSVVGADASSWSRSPLASTSLRSVPKRRVATPVLVGRHDRLRRARPSASSAWVRRRRRRTAVMSCAGSIRRAYRIVYAAGWPPAVGASRCVTARSGRSRPRTRRAGDRGRGHVRGRASTRRTDAGSATSRSTTPPGDPGNAVFVATKGGDPGPSDPCAEGVHRPDLRAVAIDERHYRGLVVAPSSPRPRLRLRGHGAMNLAVWVERHGRRRPDDPALADGEQRPRQLGRVRRPDRRRGRRPARRRRPVAR